jgi:hypothetical protein
MSAVWTILSVALLIFGIFRLVLKGNRLLASGFASPRFFRVMIILCLILVAWAALLLSMEFVTNKGPDDLGALWHAGYPLSAKYGKMQHTSYTLESFSLEDGGSGTYDIRYNYNGHAGEILCHYSKPKRQFDRDQIQETP